MIYNDEWKNPDLVFIKTYQFIDKYDNTAIAATIRVIER